jgi:hypothetical protein
LEFFSTRTQPEILVNCESAFAGNSKSITGGFEFPANALSQLTRISGCVLVEKDSKIVGIITSSDLLKMM